MGPGERARLSGVDGLRALAALSVFFCHLGAYWHIQAQLPAKLGSASELGAHGVDLFVVISGFCLALPVARSGLALDRVEFFIRRATRILPPYYLALAICAALAIAPATSHYVVGSRAGAGSVLAHGVFAQSLIQGQSGTINGSFWSVALEVQLYLMFPLLVLAWRRFGLDRVLVVTAVVSLAWTILRPTHSWILGSTEVLPDRLVQFTAGALAASLVVAGRVPARRLLWAGVLVGGALAVLASTSNFDYGTTMLWTVPSLCIVLLGSTGFSQRAHGRALVRIGVWSYSFYLLQQPVLLMTSPVAHRVTNSPTLLLVLGSTCCLTVVVAGSWLMHRLIERPSIQFGARLVVTRRERLAATAAPAVTIADTAQPALGTTG
jgi:peptidoglycan/LPS O-acetylase OafA/YrhL